MTKDVEHFKLCAAVAKRLDKLIAIHNKQYDITDLLFLWYRGKQFVNMLFFVLRYFSMRASFYLIERI